MQHHHNGNNFSQSGSSSNFRFSSETTGGNEGQPSGLYGAGTGTVNPVDTVNGKFEGLNIIATLH